MKKSNYAVFALPFVNLTYLVIAVVTADLIRAFSNFSSQTVLLVLSLPALTSIAGILAMPLLTPHFSKKSLGVFGLVLTLIGGILCFIYYDNLYVLITASGLLGIAYGFISPAYTLLIGQLFDGDRKNTMMGVSSCIMNVGRLIIVFIAGFLAVIKWQYVFFTYIFVAIAIVVVLFLLPSDIPTAKNTDSAKHKIHITGKVWFYAIIGIFFTTIYYVNATNCSQYIEGYNLGTAATTGTITSITCAAAAITALFFGKIVKYTKNYTLLISFAILGLGYLWAGIFVSFAGIFMAMLSAAVSMSLLTPYLMARVGAVVDNFSIAAATSLILALMNLGYFISPSVISSLCKLFGQTSQASVFFISGIITMIIGLVCLLDDNKKRA